MMAGALGLLLWHGTGYLLASCFPYLLLYMVPPKMQALNFQKHTFDNR